MKNRNINAYTYIGLIKDSHDKCCVLHSAFSPEFISERVVPECYLSVEDMPIENVSSIMKNRNFKEGEHINVKPMTVCTASWKAIIDKLINVE